MSVNDAYLGMECHSPAKPTLCCPIYGADRPQHFPEVLLEKGAAKRNSPYTLALQEVEECLPDRERRGRGGGKGARPRHCVLLDTLSAENRVIFMRRYWFSDSCRDIAGLVGLSEKYLRPADPDPKEAETISGRREAFL